MKMKASIRVAKSDRLFYFVSNCVMAFALFITLYPLYFVVIASISAQSEVAIGNVFLWPKKIQFTGYEKVFSYSTIWPAYRNTIFYAITGTMTSLLGTISAGFVFSRRGIVGSRICMLAVIFTMYFSGGLIPSYFNIQSLGMLNTVWAMIIPGAISGYYLILTRSFIQSTIPEELWEASAIDGCSHVNFFVRVVVPLSTPLIAVMALFSVVGQWNSYMSALIYLRDRNLYPLQLILQEILVNNQIS